jgi:hypothetical protein
VSARNNQGVDRRRIKSIRQYLSRKQRRRIFIRTLNAASRLRSTKGHEPHPGVGEPRGHGYPQIVKLYQPLYSLPNSDTPAANALSDRPHHEDRTLAVAKYYVRLEEAEYLLRHSARYYPPKEMTDNHEKATSPTNLGYK